MGFLKNKRYYFRVFFSIIIILIIFTSLLVTSIYSNMKRYIAGMENNKSMIILSQMKYNLEYINDMIRDLCLSVYYSSDTKVLMYLNGEETYDDMSRINRINALRARSNSLIHSIHVYNNNKKILYSTYHSLKIQDDICMQIINNTYPLPVLKPILRSFKDNLTGEDTNVLSYFMYDLTDANKVMDGGIVVNVDVEWLMHSLVELNALSNKNERIYIYSLLDKTFLASDEIPYQSTDDKELIRGRLDKLPADWVQGEEAKYSFETDQRGTESYVYCEKVKNTDWVLVKVQSYLTLKEYFGQIYISLFSIAGIALILAIIAYYVITRRLYLPVKNIMSMMPKDSLSATNDEFEIIHNTFEHYNQELSVLKSKNNSYSEIAKSFFLRQLLLDSRSIKAEDINTAKSEHHFNFDFEKPITIAVLKINGYKDLSQNNALQDANLAKFAVQNISKELAGNHLPCEMVDMEGDNFVLIQNTNNHTQKELSAVYKEIQQTCLSVLDISLEITLSTAIQNLSLLTDLYNKAIYNSNYRVILGSHSVIYDEMIQNMKLTNNTDLVFKLEDKLVKDLNEPSDILLRDIGMLFDELKKLEYNSIVFSVVRLLKITTDVINEANQNCADTLIKSPYMLNYNILENYCLDEIKEHIILAFTEIKSKQAPEIKQNKESSIVLDAKRMIDNEYSNIDLNASKISEVLGVSSSRLSSIFNRYMNMTIPEYLNTVRLMNAAELLRNSDYNISTIMQRIGISNESYFYRLFKNKYKMTPREYVAAQKSHE